MSSDHYDTWRKIKWEREHALLLLIGWGQSQSETSTKLRTEGGKTPGIIWYDNGKSLTEESLNKNEMSIKQFTTSTQT
jgi:hypothetical protein